MSGTVRLGSTDIVSAIRTRGSAVRRGGHPSCLPHALHSLERMSTPPYQERGGRPCTEQRYRSAGWPWCTMRQEAGTGSPGIPRSFTMETVLDGVNHIAVLTKDMDRFIRFYQEAFDATVVHDDRHHGGHEGERMV